MRRLAGDDVRPEEEENRSDFTRKETVVTSHARETTRGELDGVAPSTPHSSCSCSSTVAQ